MMWHAGKKHTIILLFRELIRHHECSFQLSLDTYTIVLKLNKSLIHW